MKQQQRSNLNALPMHPLLLDVAQSRLSHKKSIYRKKMGKLTKLLHKNVENGTERIFMDCD